MKNHAKYVLAPAVLAASLAALGATDAQAGPGVARWMNYNDLNNDGVVARDELRHRRVQNFDTMDSNGNGVLDDGDFSGIVARRIGVDRFAIYISVLDANGDGVASFDEVAYGPMPGFDAADANHDNGLTRSEIEVFLAGFGY